MNRYGLTVTETTDAGEYQLTYSIIGYHEKTWKYPQEGDIEPEDWTLNGIPIDARDVPTRIYTELLERAGGNDAL